MPDDEPHDRLGGRELVTLDPYNCPTCNRRVLGRAPHQGAGPCNVCTYYATENESETDDD